jgi:hypothetical protein
MALRDPVAVYDAASNLEALLVRDGLIAAGVEAFVVEDVSQVGTWMGGLVPGIHKPQVWVDRADAARAGPILATFEERAAGRRDAGGSASADPPIAVVCEECQAPASFPASQKGSVQQCAVCGAYLDVGEAELPDGWTEADGESE